MMDRSRSSAHDIVAYLQREDAETRALVTQLLQGNEGAGYIAATLVGAWINVTGTGLAVASYMKDANGIVRLKGVVSSGAGTIFTLPPGYRPAERLIFGVPANDAFGRIDVAANGVVSLLVGSSAYVSLSNVTFAAEQ